jgi:hypothetical protein
MRVFRLVGWTSPFQCPCEVVLPSGAATHRVVSKDAFEIVAVNRVEQHHHASSSHTCQCWQQRCLLERFPFALGD